MCTEMARLVDGVLVASRLEAGVFTVEPRRRHGGPGRSSRCSRVFTPRRDAPPGRARRSTGRSSMERAGRPAEAPAGARQPRRQRAEVHPARGQASRVRVARERATSVVFEIADTGPGHPRGRARGASSTATSRARAGARRGAPGWGSPSPGASPRLTTGPSRWRRGTRAEPRSGWSFRARRVASEPAWLCYPAQRPRA